MIPRSASYRPRQDWTLSRDFTWSAKPALEKQTSQLSRLIQQCMGSVSVWPLAGPIKCNWSSVTLWLAFQYPVTYDKIITIAKIYSNCTAISNLEF